MQALKIQVNLQVEKMRKEFIQDNMGFNTLKKEGAEPGTGEKIASMSLNDKVKPSYGVELRNGDDVQKGPDYQSRMENRLTKK